MTLLSKMPLLLLCGVAAGGLQRLQKFSEELAERGWCLRPGTGQRRKSPEKRQFSEEVAERRGPSVLRPGCDEWTDLSAWYSFNWPRTAQGCGNLSILHVRMHHFDPTWPQQFIHSFIRSFVRSFIHSFISFIQLFIHSFIHFISFHLI